MAKVEKTVRAANMTRPERALLRAALNNLEIMRGRVKALIECPEALDHLCEEDVFGKRYESLLRGDIRALDRVLVKAKALRAGAPKAPRKAGEAPKRL